MIIYRFNSPIPWQFTRTIEFMFLVLLDALLYIISLLYEDDRTLVYPYGDAVLFLLLRFHADLFLGNKKPARSFERVGRVKRKRDGTWLSRFL